MVDEAVRRLLTIGDNLVSADGFDEPCAEVVRMAFSPSTSLHGISRCQSAPVLNCASVCDARSSCTTSALRLPSARVPHSDGLNEEAVFFTKDASSPGEHVHHIFTGQSACACACVVGVSEFSSQEAPGRVSAGVRGMRMVVARRW